MTNKLNKLYNKALKGNLTEQEFKDYEKEQQRKASLKFLKGGKL